MQYASLGESPDHRKRHNIFQSVWSKPLMITNRRDGAKWCLERVWPRGEIAQGALGGDHYHPGAIRRHFIGSGRFMAS